MSPVKWSSYADVFNAIVTCIHRDYAGYEDLKERDMPQLAARVSLYHSRPFHGDDAKFLQLVRLYLRCFGDPNLKLVKAAPDPLRDWSVGFSVRAAKDALIVTECPAESRLSAGDRIVRVNGLPLSEFRHGRRALVLGSEVPEREMWDYFLQYAVELTIEGRSDPSGSPPLTPAEPVRTESRTGTETGTGTETANPPVRTIQPRRFPVPPPDPVLSFHRPAAHACLLRVDSLADPEAVFACVNAHEAEIIACDTLLLDLRRCAGGTLDSVLPLLTFLIDRPTVAADLFPEKGLYVRRRPSRSGHTRTAADHSRAEGAGETRSGTSIPERNSQNEDAVPAPPGFLWQSHEFLNELQVLVTPAPGPRQVKILTDVFCREEAEVFLQMAAPLPKVRLIGRPSRGASDYQAPVTVSFEDDFLFTYPSAKTAAAMEGRGIFGQGVPVDLYLPWTPEECTRDVILEKALEI